MKKLFVIALGVLLVVAFTATSYAATKTSFSGAYRVRGYYLNNQALQTDSDLENKASFINHRFRFAMTFMPSDKLSLHVNLQVWENNKWGQDTTGAAEFARLGGPTNYAAAPEVYRVFMAIKTSIGMFRIGRMSAGIAGIGLHGYGASPVGADRAVMDTEQPFDRILWYLPVPQPWLVVVGYNKFFELDSDPNFNVTNEQEQDYDVPQALLLYRFSTGTANIAAAYYRNRMTAGSKQDWYRFIPALSIKFGPVFFNAEVDYRTGKTKTTGAADVDHTGLGVYLDVGYKYGPGEIGALYAWFKGDDGSDATDDKDFTTSGGDYYPLVLFQDEGVAIPGLVSPLYGSNNTANFWQLAFWWDHSLTEDLLLHAAYGYFAVNELNAAQVKADGSEYDKSIGSEIDIGLRYNIMQNLTYTAIFGYFIPGDYIKDAAETEVGRDVGNSYMFRHELKITF